MDYSKYTTEQLEAIHEALSALLSGSGPIRKGDIARAANAAANAISSKIHQPQ